jgi:hypothetical protein
MICEGQEFVGQSDKGDVIAVVKKGIFQAKTRLNSDGSLTEPIHTLHYVSELRK